MGVGLPFLTLFLGLLLFFLWLFGSCAFSALLASGPMVLLIGVINRCDLVWSVEGISESSQPPS